MKQYCNVLILEVTGGLSHYKLVKDLIEKISKKKKKKKKKKKINKQKQKQLRSDKNQIVQSQVSRPMGKPTICIGENKGADQRRKKAKTKAQISASDSTLPPLLNSKISSF